jgi:SAM-dependent methyltransferase
MGGSGPWWPRSCPHRRRGSSTSAAALARSVWRWARVGHDVTAIDPDPSAIELADRRTPDRPGRLAYHQGDVATWGADEAGFDVIVTSRALHHVPEPAAALERIHDWLRPGGPLVCVDFLHDRFDRRDARRLAQVRGLLEATGSHPATGGCPPTPPPLWNAWSGSGSRTTSSTRASTDLPPPKNHSADGFPPTPDRGTPTSTGTSSRSSMSPTRHREGHRHADRRLGSRSPRGRRALAVLQRFVGHRDPG